MFLIAVQGFIILLMTLGWQGLYQFLYKAKLVVMSGKRSFSVFSDTEAILMTVRAWF